MRNSVLVATLTLAAMAAFSAAAQTGQVVAAKAPGQVGIAQTVDVAAKIVAINRTTREVTLKGPQGSDVVVVAGPEVKNFAQLKKGDTVDVKYIEALVLELKKGGGLPVARTEKS